MRGLISCILYVPFLYLLLWFVFLNISHKLMMWFDLAFRDLTVRWPVRSCNFKNDILVSTSRAWLEISRHVLNYYWAVSWWREDRSLPLIRGNDGSARHWQITIFWEPSSMIVMLVLVCNLVGKCRAGRHLFCFLKDSVQTGHAHKQSTVCNAHEQTIVRRQLSAVTYSAYHLYRKLENFGENSNWTFHLAGNFSDERYTFWGIGFFPLLPKRSKFSIPLRELPVLRVPCFLSRKSGQRYFVNGTTQSRSFLTKRKTRPYLLRKILANCPSKW